MARTSRYAAGRPRSWFGLRTAHLHPPNHGIIRNFFADRCTHLAAMVAYYALLSLLPTLFLALTLLGVLGEADESSFLIQEIEKALPGQSVDGLLDTVNALRRNTASLGLIGFVALIWAALGFLSALESALNIIYEVPNRAFFRQKAFVFGLIGATLATLFASLVVTTALATFLRSHGASPGFVSGELLLSIAFSSTISFLFLAVVYRFLPNTPIAFREVLPGAVFGTLVTQGSFQALPIYLRFTDTLPTLKAFGGIAVTLVWIFLMCNILLLGAEINWWYGRGRHEQAAREAAEEEVAAGLS